MELWKKSWLIFKRRWPILLTPVVLALAGVTAYDAFVPKDHIATTTLFLRAPDVKSSASAYQGNLFTMQRAVTYTNMVQSDELAQLVVDKLGLNTTAHELASKVEGAPVRDTVIIDISVTDRDPQQAANLANTYGSEFASYVAKVEAADLAPDVPPLVTTVKAATADDAVATGFPLWMLLVFAGVPALVLGIVLVWLAERYDHRIRSRRQVEEVTGAPVLGTITTNRLLGSGDTVDDAFAESREFADETRALSINIEHALRDIDKANGPVVLAVTSVSEGDGKSVVANALVKALDERGRSASLLSVGPDGLSHERDGSRTEVFASASGRRERQPKTNRRMGGSSSEHAITAAIDDLSHTNEFIVIDPAGSGAAPESQIAASLSDAVVIVVKPGVNDENSLADLVNGMAILGTPIVGAVANRAKETNTTGRFYS